MVCGHWTVYVTTKCINTHIPGHCIKTKNEKPSLFIKIQNKIIGRLSITAIETLSGYRNLFSFRDVVGYKETINKYTRDECIREYEPCPHQTRTTVIHEIIPSTRAPDKEIIPEHEPSPSNI